jgi:hypothetical protein
MPDFNKLLDADPTSFERPPTVPEGEFLLLIKGKELGTSAQKKTPYVRFHYQVMTPLESVPEDALEGIDLSKLKPRDDFYLTEDAMFRLREFFEMVGAVENSTRESIEACIGKQVVATFGHTQSQRDPTRVFSEIRSYSRAE